MDGYANCDEACGLVHKSGGGAAAPSGPTLQQQMAVQAAGAVGYAIGNALHDAMFGNPQQEAIRRQEQERLKAQAAQEAAARQRQEAAHQAELKSQLKLSGSNIDGSLDLKRASDQPARIAEAKPEHTADARPKVACQAGAGGRIAPNDQQAVCAVVTCGGTNQQPVCCPADHPILNECDCQCYATAQSFDCMIGYADCRQTFVPNNPTR